MSDSETYNAEQQPVVYPVDGVLDLHTFNPREVKELLLEYIHACRKKGIFEIRIIHGKGTGTLRETVHSILKNIPEVASYRFAGEDGGGWGATIATLERLSEPNHR